MGTALVVEDSLTEREIITQCLKLAGITVVIASSGEEALEKLLGDLPDVIVLDVVLPGRSGFEICRELKAENRTNKIPVIICSTKDTDMDKYWGMRQGADAYIPKPIDQDFFLKTIKQLIHH
ncbi:response regulator transcription factor [Aphanothece sacrum]|uniref:Two-component sensor histidine kinase n=1 Tax=Aphanothece sacrum FPU1 TaxID=1920663 RepID=A0A401IL44_APHSA|nr:response regulator [Aphanothece sacrum]GBF81974.1 two-component sensor histidine kinase [Aphanothece sacrum FPU1]GBF83603.1 two-component sensor histidine kinase [Aphanothece sacrum FPU3]